MCKTPHYGLCLTLLLSLSSKAFAQTELNATSAAQNSELQLYQESVNFAMATVKTKAELEALLKRSSPLDTLSDEGRKTFVDSLILTRRGVGGFNYKPLEDELTPTQIYKILQLFGAQHMTRYFQNAHAETATDLLLLSVPKESGEYENELDVPDNLQDHEGYQCVGPGTCEESLFNICTSNC